MSDFHISIIPVNPYLRLSNDVSDEVINYLKSCVIADSIDFYIYDTPSFIDSGSNFKKIRCPICNDDIPNDWWEKAMNNSYETKFAELDIELPCCCKPSSLNNLLYDFSCGFACIKIDIMNPVGDLNDLNIKYIEEILNFPIRIIRTHI